MPRHNAKSKGPVKPTLRTPPPPGEPVGPPAPLTPAVNWYYGGRLDEGLVREFRAKVNALADETFGRTPDGYKTSPVQVLIVDRTRYEPVYAEPLPHATRENVESLEAITARVLAMRRNVSWAIDGLAIAHAHLESAVRRATEREKKDGEEKVEGGGREKAG